MFEAFRYEFSPTPFSVLHYCLLGHLLNKCLDTLRHLTPSLGVCGDLDSCLNCLSMGFTPTASLPAASPVPNPSAFLLALLTSCIKPRAPKTDLGRKREGRSACMAFPVLSQGHVWRSGFDTGSEHACTTLTV